MAEGLTFVKLGGSLITDKHTPLTPHTALLARLAQEIRAVRDAAPALPLLVGHGSGSFGHWEASHYGTRHGVHTPEEWRGLARVGAAAAQLNRLVTDTFLKAGVPVFSLAPSAAVIGEAGHLVAWELEPLRRVLAAGLIPLIYGDVALDRAWGGTIFSTEDLFVYLALRLQPARILLLGNAPGVLDAQGQVIPQITPATYPALAPLLGGSAAVDVTGGMADKVAQMVALVEQVPGLRVWILSGQPPGALQRALLELEATGGTCICAAEDR